MEIMVPSLFFAKVFGIYALAVGLSLFLNPARFRMMYQRFLVDEQSVMLGGVLALLIGAFVIAAHNVWVWDWPVLITILGYWAVIKGVALLISPGFIQFFKPMLDSGNGFFKGVGFFWMIIGLLLVYIGFVA